MALIQVNFMSKCLLRTVPLQVILPVDKFSLAGDDAPKEKPFKTLYLLHGMFGDCTDWLTGTRIKRWAEGRDLAVVMPSGDNAFYVDQPQSGNLYGEFIGRELVDITRRMFPLSRKREDTFIGGLSMGGFGAVRNGLKYHGTFSRIICLSGALHIPEHPETVEKEGLAFANSFFGDPKEAVKSDKNPRILIEQLKRKQAEGLAVFPKIFQSCGTEDNLLAFNRAYRDIFLKNGIEVSYHEAAGGHDWVFWDTWIQKALDWLPLEEERQGVNSGNIKG